MDYLEEAQNAAAEAAVATEDASAVGVPAR